MRKINPPRMERIERIASQAGRWYTVATDWFCSLVFMNIVGFIPRDGKHPVTSCICVVNLKTHLSDALKCGLRGMTVARIPQIVSQC